MRRKPHIAGWLFLILLFAVSGKAEDYLVGPGDVLSIKVWQEDDISGDYLVNPRGEIDFPLLGGVPVRGLNTTAVAARLREALSKDYYVHPVVSVNVAEYHSKKVYIFGFVNRPGVYELNENRYLLNVILAAGGPTEQNPGDLTILRFVVKDGKETIENLKVNLEALLSKGDLSQNVTLLDGDILFLSPGGGATFEERRQFYVLGEVKHPGAYPLGQGYTILNAVLAAGGFTDYAAPDRTKLVRNRNGEKTVETIPMEEILKGDNTHNVTLQPGDLINVPESYF